MSENGTIGLGWDSYLSNMYDMWKVFAVLQVNRPALVSLWLVECHMVYVTHQTMNILWLILWADKHTQTNVYKQLTFTSGIHKLSIQLGSDFDSFRLSSDFFCNISLVTWKNNFGESGYTGWKTLMLIFKNEILWSFPHPHVIRNLLLNRKELSLLSVPQKKAIQVWKDMRVSKWSQNFRFQVNCPFKNQYWDWENQYFFPSLEKSVLMAKGRKRDTLQPCELHGRVQADVLLINIILV